MERTINSREKQPVPKMYRRDVRLGKRLRRGFKYRSDRQAVGSSIFNVVGLSSWGAAPIYIQKRKKLKGWQKQRA